MLLGIVDFYHFIPLSVAVTLGEGYTMSRKRNLLASFSCTLLNWSRWNLRWFEAVQVEHQNDTFTVSSLFSIFIIFLCRENDITLLVTSTLLTLACILVPTKRFRSNFGLRETFELHISILFWEILSFIQCHEGERKRKLLRQLCRFSMGLNDIVYVTWGLLVWWSWYSLCLVRSILRGGCHIYVIVENLQTGHRFQTCLSDRHVWTLPLYSSLKAPVFINGK